MIPEKPKFIDELREYSDGSLRLLLWAIKEKSKRGDIFTVIKERGLK